MLDGRWALNVVYADDQLHTLYNYITAQFKLSSAQMVHNCTLENCPALTRVSHAIPLCLSAIVIFTFSGLSVHSSATVPVEAAGTENGLRV